MASLNIVTANNCDYPSTNAARRVEGNSAERDLWVAFSGAVSESIISKTISFEGIVIPINITLFLCFPTATSGSAIFEVAVMSVVGGASINLATTVSYDAPNTSNPINAPSNVNNPVTSTIILTNNDSITELNYVKFKISRNPSNINDNIATDCYLIAAIINDAR